MSSVPLFAPVFKSMLNNVPLNHHTSELSKKRKRGRSDSLGSLEDLSDGKASAFDFANSNLSPETIAQYETAGQPYDEYLPGHNFPHEAPRTTMDYSSDASDDDLDAFGELASAVHSRSYSLTGARTAGSHTGLRRQHFAVLNAVLYRCMLERDYVRAGRAWGMLLRVDLDGRSMDLRADGVWGLGAEILMFRDSQLANSQTEPLNDQREFSINKRYLTELTAGHRMPALFSRDGFLKAKDYYERLMLQYPFRKAASNTVSSLDFFPAMFGLWIYSVQEQGRATYKIMREANGVKNQRSKDEKIHATIQKQTLEQISEINARLDELLVSPPYSDDAKLWQLRCMVAVWEADLVSSFAFPELYDESAGGSHNPFQEKLIAIRSKARQAFETVSRLDNHCDFECPNIDEL
ncbi:MAG: hypothetical protein HETSPECPRED_007429 [Heterodermia speciosa]|uniref:Uncharacterized protein n=1 Tax=Heterodermia speciosa TaxID=116794 RepID=A0A8H3IWF8_9LECA|nr:MAG: hypothetical protein HETSPECPRED_007429 [Heterodermia speciosa]